MHGGHTGGRRATENAAQAPAVGSSTNHRNQSSIVRASAGGRPASAPPRGGRARGGGGGGGEQGRRQLVRFLGAEPDGKGPGHKPFRHQFVLLAVEAYR